MVLDDRVMRTRIWPVNCFVFMFENTKYAKTLRLHSNSHAFIRAHYRQSIFDSRHPHNSLFCPCLFVLVFAI